MIMIILTVGMGIFVLYFQINRFLESKKTIKINLEKSKYEIHTYGKLMFLLYLLFFVIAVSCIFYASFIKDDTSLGLGIMLTTLIAGELLNFKYSHTIYYNDDAIIVNGEHVRYRTIKTLKKRGLAKRTLDITTLKGKLITTSIIAYQYISKHTKFKL